VLLDRRLVEVLHEVEVGVACHEEGKTLLTRDAFGRLIRLLYGLFLDVSSCVLKEFAVSIKVFIEDTRPFALVGRCNLSLWV